MATDIETNGKAATLPVSFIPVPTDAFRRHRKMMKATVQPGRPAAPVPSPVPVPPGLSGTRVLIWKQDPSVAEIGVRRAYLPGVTLAGPHDGRIGNGTPGIAAVSPNVFGDFVQTPGSDAFDAVHTYAVVRQTLTLYQRALATGGSAAPLPWAWNGAGNTEPLAVFPHGLPNVINAFYSRAQKALKFGDFTPTGSTTHVFTCRSFDIVSHETGHAVLDGLKPQWLLAGQPPQTGALHESFGDLTAIFLTLSQLDQVEAIIAQTKANLHDKTFLADLAEQFGLALGRPNGLRNADNNLKLSEVSNEVHDLSQVFTGAVYDILADVFRAERKPAVRDDAAVLYEAGQYLCHLVLWAVIDAPASGATYLHVANKMHEKAKPEYKDFVRNNFTLRGVPVASAPLAAAAELQSARRDAVVPVQDRRACCGTMNNPEFTDARQTVEAELDQLKTAVETLRR
jgi:hypothetical protein